MKIQSILLAATFAISSSAFAGGHHIYMTSPDYSAIDDMLEARAQAQYEEQVQQQLNEITAQISQVAAMQAAQAAQRQQEMYRQQLEILKAWDIDTMDQTTP